MSRPLRPQIPDGIYHVTCRGLERRPIVRDDVDRRRWTDLLSRVAQRRQWPVFAWSLLNNHCHLFLRTPHADLSAGMHDLNSAYATAFNRRHGRNGPLFQGRFHAILVERQFHYWELSRYIHLNPVRAGLAEAPERYAWSSCMWYFRDRGSPEWLAREEVLQGHGKSWREARAAYRAFLAEGIQSRPKSPLLEAHTSGVLGSASFVEKVKDWLQDWLVAGRSDAEVPQAKRLGASRLALGDIELVLCRAYGISRGRLCEKGRHGNEPRRMAIYLARTMTPASIAEVGGRFGGICGSAVSRIVQQVIARRATDKGFAARLVEMERKCQEREK